MAIKSTEEYIENHPHWRAELEQFREMLLGTELTETIKWGVPVYTFQGKNIVGTAAFKNHIALWFYQGALLKENTDLLMNAQEGKTKALRQIRFEKGDPINKELLRNYVLEAIQNQREGKEIKPERHKNVEIPEELEQVFKNNPNLNEAFEQLTTGRQREYCEYIATAKREATKLSRIEKITPMILVGKGLNDQYK
ncbi:MAG TPA: DUF1801 domain-containing protein [Flavobacteriaceae bacterium]|nr:DUF1801 domain-containing protein [Flavobacteriaceae bacterium]